MTKDARGVATVSEDEFLADDQVIDACVRAWLGPVALLTIGLRVVVASVQADQGHAILEGQSDANNATSTAAWLCSKAAGRH